MITEKISANHSNVKMNVSAFTHKLIHTHTHTPVPPDPLKGVLRDYFYRCVCLRFPQYFSLHSGCAFTLTEAAQRSRYEKKEEERERKRKEGDLFVLSARVRLEVMAGVVIVIVVDCS